MATVQDLVQGVKDKLSNRTDIDDKCPKWIAKAVQELTASYPFEELRLPGPVYPLTINTAEYDINLFINSGTSLTRVVSFFIFYSGSTGPGFNLKYRTPPVIDAYMRIPGMPVYWSRFGRSIQIGFNPQSIYNVQMKYQMKHEFDPIDPSNNNIKMPDEWLEIVEYAAAMRGAWEERMYDYTDKIKVLLYGDPEFQRSGVAGKGEPGLIHRRLSQFERDSDGNERSMPVVVQKY